MDHHFAGGVNVLHVEEIEHPDGQLKKKDLF
jgi:hypothetical protein